MTGNLAQTAGPFAPGRCAALARRIVRAHGRSALDHFKLLPDKSLFFSGDGAAFLAYGRAPGTAVVLGDPVGPPESVEPILRSFLQRFEARGRSVVFLQIGGAALDLYRALGYSPVRIGASASVDLESLDMGAPAAKFLRHARRRLARADLAVKHAAPPLPAVLVTRL
ncbi:MAG: phosphatidylglycerol lysyltransferase domain-containing protein, partial [Myxococcota bacterium]